MTKLVIDASAALYALSGAQGRSALDRHDVAAPPLLWSEVTAAFRQRVYRRELGSALAAQALAELNRAPIRRITDRRIYPSAYELATRLGWAKTYDAEYIALAKLLGRPLLTADARLARGAAGIVDIVTAADLEGRQVTRPVEGGSRARAQVT